MATDHVKILEELEKIESLPVLHRIDVTRNLYEEGNRLGRLEWWEKNRRSFSYYFLIERGICSIFVDSPFGEMTLLTVKDKYTHTAVKKAISKFHQKYKYFKK